MKKPENTAQLPVNLCQGYDSFKGEVRNAAVTPENTFTINAESSNRVSICTDTSSVLNALKISAEVEGKFFNAELAASVSWADSLNLTATSVAVIVSTVAVKGTTQSDTNSFQINLPSTAQEFFHSYGDSFVNQVILGGQYYAAFIFDSQTTDQQTKIEADLRGQAGGLKATLSGELQKTADKTQTAMRIEQQMYGSNAAYPELDPETIVTFALHFKGDVIDSPTLLSFSLTGYEHVPGLSYSDWDAVVANRELLGEDGLPFVDDSDALTALSSQVAAIERVYAAYQYTGDSLFTRNAAQIKKDFAAFSDLIGQIETNVIGTYTAPSLMSLGFGSPQLSYTLNPGNAPFGNGSPTFFDLTPFQIANGVTPAAITLYAGAGIQVTYSDGSQTSHGLTTGTAMGTLSLTGDSISSVVIAKLPVVQFLQINTANGHSIGNIPAGFPSTTYSAPSPLIGFCGVMMPAPIPLIQSLTPIAVRLSPAVWVNAITSAPPTLRKVRSQAPTLVHARAQA